MFVRAAFAIILLLLPTTLYAQEPTRLALVIGNQDYAAKVGPLKNPRSDAALVERSLKQLGFRVTVLKDASYKAMDSALKRYVTEVRRAGRKRAELLLLFGSWCGQPGDADQLPDPG